MRDYGADRRIVIEHQDVTGADLLAGAGAVSGIERRAKGALKVNLAISLHATSNGKVLLAWLPEEELDAGLADATPDANAADARWSSATARSESPTRANAWPASVR